MGLDIKPVYKLTKFLTQTSSKLYKPKTSNKVINSLIYKNR